MTTRLPFMASTGRQPYADIPARIAIILLFAITLAGLSGCRTSPVKEVDNQGFSASGVSLAQVGEAIKGAGASLGWVMKEKRPGMINGTIYLRDHVAKVEIPYTTRSYSIRYVDSTNLKYKAEKGTIHSNYNGWVTNLDNMIRTRLESL